MVDRPAHLATRYRDSLTPRQQEILAMIAKGKTNFEIAQQFGMSLDGAKWHVREILAKLNVDSREDAVAEWQRQRSFGARLRVFARALLPAALLKPVVAGTAAIGVAGAIAVGVVMLQGGDDEPPAAESPTPATTSTPAAGTPDPGGILKEPLPGDGSAGYAYDPELAYVDPDGVVWLVRADGSDRRQVLDGCTGVGSPKSGVLTGGLRWSPSGNWIACWKEDLSVRAAAIDGSASGEPFAPGECIGPIGGPAFPPGAPGVACETPSGLQVRDVVSAAVVASFPTETLGAHRWLPDGSLVTAAPPEANHGTWKVFAPDGTEVVHIKGAFIGEARQFAITSDGRKLAYPAADGLTVLDLETGDSHTVDNPAFADVDWGGGGDVSWALGGSALVFHGYPVSALVDADTGESLTSASLPTSGRISPDGQLLVGVALTNEGRTTEIAVTDLGTGNLTVVEDSIFRPEGMGFGTHFTWSGDSSRFCWTNEANAPAATRYCASVEDPVAVAIDRPLAFRSEELGYGDLDIMWEMLSPDLELVSALRRTAGGPATTLLALAVESLVGSRTFTELGQALSEYASAWRPDAVVRPD